jgi:hypothetical protein
MIRYVSSYSITQAYLIAAKIAFNPPNYNHSLIIDTTIRIAKSQ